MKKDYALIASGANCPLQLDPHGIHVPVSVQRQAIELWNRQQRCAEEESVLRDEMHQICLYYVAEQAVLIRGLTRCRETDNPGAALIFKKLFLLESKYRQVMHIFSGHIQTIPRMNYVVSESIHDEEETVSNCDEEEYDDRVPSLSSDSDGYESE